MFGKKGSTYLERQNETLTAELVKALRESQQLNAKLAEGLDRVLTAKFDAPLMPKPTEQPKRERPFMDLGDVLSVEDDNEFLERMEAGTTQ
jgi:hypothetical protein